jgi:hypothetical protein
VWVLVRACPRHHKVRGSFFALLCLRHAVIRWDQVVEELRALDEAVRSERPQSRAAAAAAAAALAAGQAASVLRKDGWLLPGIMG